MSFRTLIFILLCSSLTACSTPAAATATLVPTQAPPTTAVTASPSATPPAPVSPTAAPTLTATPAAESATQVPTVPASPTAAPTPDLPAQAIYGYLEARAKTDLALTLSLSCSAWDGQASVEVTSFRSMNAVLEGVACATTGQADGFTLVSCGGKMITTYGGESRDWDLSSFVYQAAQEDGVWTMCGYH